MKRIVFVSMVIGLAVFGCRAKPSEQSTDASDKTALPTAVDSATHMGQKSVMAKTNATPQKKARASNISVSSSSVASGTTINKKGVPLNLVGAPIALGAALPAVTLRDVVADKDVSTSSLIGKVLVISIVPAISTPVCTAQSRFLETEGNRLSSGIQRVTLSRDPPADLLTFARQTGDPSVLYLSDYPAGLFGRSTGLFVPDADILARSVIVTDKSGIVRYIQVVPELTELPDMEKAFQRAMALSTTPESGQ